MLPTNPTQRVEKVKFFVKTRGNTMVGICGGEVLVATFRAEICPDNRSTRVLTVFTEIDFVAVVTARNWDTNHLKKNPWST